MHRIRVSSARGSYAVLFGRGVLRRGARLLRQEIGAGPAFLISSPRVWRSCGGRLTAALGRRAVAKRFLIDDREASKTLATVESLCRTLARSGADRQSTLLAVGGGVVGDVAGFVAASYLRGVSLVHVPTTLLAQVDSAIGGKSGVNLPEGKNLVGAFYPPQLVLVDPGLLDSLPRRLYRSGIYEVIKYGVIGDPPLFEFLERRMEDLLARAPAEVDWVIPRCIRAKARIVGRDEREGGRRQILNFGHTIGHALEAGTNYREFLHGEAVGWGMLAATQIAVQDGLLARGDALRIQRLIARVGPLPQLGAIPVNGLLARMRADKKMRGGHLRWVLPRQIGRAEVGFEVAEKLVRDSMLRLPELLLV